MRVAVALTALLVAACGTTRTVEVPEPYEDSGIRVTVKPRVHADWPLGFETIRGTVENRTGHDVDLHLFLNLVDDKGAVVGYAHEFKPGLTPGERSPFEVFPMSGQPKLLDFQFFARPPPWSKVERGFVYDDRSIPGRIVYACALLGIVWATDPRP